MNYPTNDPINYPASYTGPRVLITPASPNTPYWVGGTLADEIEQTAAVRERSIANAALIGGAVLLVIVLLKR